MKISKRYTKKGLIREIRDFELKLKRIRQGYGGHSEERKAFLIKLLSERLIEYREEYNKRFFKPSK